MIPSLRLATDAIARHAHERPHHPAVTCGDETITYGPLVERADRLARRLRALGVARDDLVGLHVERSVDGVVGLVGILRSGGAYLPLDPDHPPARRALVLQDARPKVVVARSPVGGAPFLALDGPDAPDAPPADVAPEDLAYVLYTSGSTGVPKGVMVEHAALARRAEEMLRVIGLRPEDRATQFAAIGWDASLYDTLAPLVSGATLHVLRGPERVPGQGLVRYLRERRITAAFFPPSVLAALPDADLPDLRIVSVGGEAVRASLVARWGRGRAFFNLYGPTETTIWSTTEVCVPGQEPTIGRPVTGATVRIVDAGPDGIGEVYVGGDGLARGYLGRPDLTRERFVTLDGARHYRTGDRGRLLPDGRIEFHGRLDDQVKVRGARVELGDVESALARHPRVRDLAVVAVPDVRGDARLVAYLVPTSDVPAAPRRAASDVGASLRASVAERLPAPVVPSLFVELPALPLTPSGKVDRAALPVVDALLAPDPASLPRSEMERLVAGVWCEVLGLPAVGLHDAFFDLGGHSLLVADVQVRLSRALGREVDAVVLFEHGTVAALARHLGGTPVAVPVAVQGAAERGAARRAARARPVAQGGEDA